MVLGSSFWMMIDLLFTVQEADAALIDCNPSNQMKRGKKIVDVFFLNQFACTNALSQYRNYKICSSHFHCATNQQASNTSILLLLFLQLISRIYCIRSFGTEFISIQFVLTHLHKNLSIHIRRFRSTAEWNVSFYEIIHFCTLSISISIPTKYEFFRSTDE